MNTRRMPVGRTSGPDGRTLADRLYAPTIAGAAPPEGERPATGRAAPHHGPALTADTPRPESQSAHLEAPTVHLARAAAYMAGFLFHDFPDDVRDAYRRGVEKRREGQAR